MLSIHVSRSHDHDLAHACSVWPCSCPLIYIINRFIQIWNVLKLVAVIIHVCMYYNIPIPMVQHKVPFQCLHDAGTTPAIIHTIIDYIYYVYCLAIVK